MRLRELTPSEKADIDRRRATVREALAGIAAPWNPGAAAVDEAPFLDDWSTHPQPGGRTSLRGFCYGHPVLGDTIVTTSEIEQQGPGYAVTRNTLYVLGTENRDHKRDRILAGRRGRFRPTQGTVASPAEDVVDEVKP
jgi:hypothetical protein